MIKINNIPFEPHPEIGFGPCKFDPIGTMEGKRVTYRYNYPLMVEKIAAGELPERETYRTLMANDLWFMLNFVVKPFADEFGQARVNHPFVVQACQDIEEGPKDFTLDVWARFHYKTSIITTAETVQYQLLHPNHATGILSFKASVAKDFLFAIKQIFQNEAFLQYCWPDVIWANCEKEAPLWSQDEGIILKRSTNRREASISAHGLIEGMPVGLHFERTIYDDISTWDLARTPQVMESVKDVFDISRNLKSMTSSHHRVVGTYYHWKDALTYIRDKKNIEGLPKYLLRLKPATIDGSANGIPVLMTQEELNEKKGDRDFNTQMLCNPTPQEDQKLNPDFLQRVERKFVPRGTYRFMIIDQAGDAETNKTKDTDPRAMGVFDVEPYADSLGQSRVFITDLFADVMGETEAIERAVRMYIQAGIVEKLGVEKVGMSTTHIHITKALEAKGRHIIFSESSDKGTVGVLLRPAGRNKKNFIIKAVEWPLNNGKIYYSSDVPLSAIERLKNEMINFPLWNDDILNIIAYLYDILAGYYFYPQEEEDEPDIKFEQKRNSVTGY